MMNKIDLNFYKTVVFIDSMVILEGNPLDQQRWCDIDKEGPILVFVVPQVAQEIDKRKRDGRLATHARAFNRLIEPAALSGRPETIVQASPKVDICMATLSKINWDDFDDLDPDDADARVVLQVLKSTEKNDGDGIFLSQDIYPITIATRYGLQTQKLPDHWIRPPEPSPHQKEVQRLKEKVRVLETSQPEIEITVQNHNGNYLNTLKVSQLSKNEASDIQYRILKDNPPIIQESPFPGINIIQDRNYEERYESFEYVTVPTFISKLIPNLERTYNQFMFGLSLVNKGNIQAENLFVQIEIINASIYKNWSVLPSQPRAPVLRDRISDLIEPPYIPRLSRISTPAGRHEVDIDYAGDYLTAKCADFRHGTSKLIEFIINPDTSDQDIIVSVRVTASNMKGEVVENYTLQKEIEIVKVSDLLDLEKSGFIRPRPMEKELKEALESENLERFDIIDISDEDD